MNCTKRCTKCQGEFPATSEFFYKMGVRNGKQRLTSHCKKCKLKYNRDQYNKHKTKILQQKKEYWSRPEVIKQRRKTGKKYYHNKLKHRNDPHTKVRNNLSRRMRSFFSKNGSRTIDFIGCSIDDLKCHLEKQFVDGMSWENYGLYGWHVDHIRPCCSFDLTDPEQQRECFHYTNLKPLWAEDNLAKGGSFHE